MIIDVKQAIQKAKDFATDILGQSDLLLEEVSSTDDKFLVTLSMPRRAGALKNELIALNPLAHLTPLEQFTARYAAEREFKEFEVSKADGTVTRMAIREIAER